jgi:hypothetical protein
MIRLGDKVTNIVSGREGEVVDFRCENGTKILAMCEGEACPDHHGDDCENCGGTGVHRRIIADPPKNWILL